jgi:hypothetical protein
MTEKIAVEGQIISIDYGAHTLVLKDVKGNNYRMMWTSMFDDMMKGLKQWWFRKIEAEKLGDVWKITKSEFCQKPEGWKSGGGGGGYRAEPKNEAMICFLALHRDAATLAAKVNIETVEQMNRLLDDVYARAKSDSEKCMKDFGVKHEQV